MVTHESVDVHARADVVDGSETQVHEAPHCPQRRHLLQLTVENLVTLVVEASHRHRQHRRRLRV